MGVGDEEFDVGDVVGEVLEARGKRRTGKSSMKREAWKVSDSTPIRSDMY